MVSHPLQMFEAKTFRSTKNQCVGASPVSLPKKKLRPSVKSTQANTNSFDLSIAETQDYTCWRQRTGLECRVLKGEGVQGEGVTGGTLRIPTQPIGNIRGTLRILLLEVFRDPYR